MRRFSFSISILLSLLFVGGCNKLSPTAVDDQVSSEFTVAIRDNGPLGSTVADSITVDMYGLTVTIYLRDNRPDSVKALHPVAGVSWWIDGPAVDTNFMGSIQGFPWKFMPKDLGINDIEAVVHTKNNGDFRAMLNLKVKTKGVVVAKLDIVDTAYKVGGTKCYVRFNLSQKVYGAKRDLGRVGPWPIDWLFHKLNGGFVTIKGSEYAQDLQEAKIGEPSSFGIIIDTVAYKLNSGNGWLDESIVKTLSVADTSKKGMCRYELVESPGGKLSVWNYGKLLWPDTVSDTILTLAMLKVDSLIGYLPPDKNGNFTLFVKGVTTLTQVNVLPGTFTAPIVEGYGKYTLGVANISNTKRAKVLNFCFPGCEKSSLYNTGLGYCQIGIPNPNDISGL